MITRGKSPTNPSEILSSNQFKELLEQLQSQYDHIIIDTPPVLAVTDGIIISQYTGVNLIVARYAKSQMKELELTLNRFEQAGVKVNGFILNDIQRASAGYGYGYNYAYAYKAQKKINRKVIREPDQMIQFLLRFLSLSLLKLTKIYKNHSFFLNILCLSMLRSKAAF